MVTGELAKERRLHSVIGGFYAVYNTLGYGFIEAVYVTALHRELVKRGHRVAREVVVPIYYDGEEILGQRLDMIVDGTLIVEAKATSTIHPSARRQLYNYLKATRMKVGLLLHFGPEARFWRVKLRMEMNNAENFSHAENASSPAVTEPSARTSLTGE